MKLNNNKAEEKIINFVKNSYNKIEVNSGDILYNYKCQMNAVHYAIKQKDKKVAMVMCVENDWCYIHFVNYTQKQFVDNTLGEWSKMTDYYFVRWVKEKEFYGINEIFKNYRVFLQNQLGWWLRLTSNVIF